MTRKYFPSNDFGGSFSDAFLLVPPFHVEVVVALELVGVPVDGVAHDDEVEDDQVEGQEVGEAVVREVEQLSGERAPGTPGGTVDEHPVVVHLGNGKGERWTIEKFTGLTRNSFLNI